MTALAVRPPVALFERRALAVAVAALLVALGARLAVPLPGAAVPQTLQTLAVVLAGALLGSGRGALAVVLYLLLGLVGFPVFAGGAEGLEPLLGPGGGFLIGFLPAAMLAGAARGRRPPGVLAILLAAHALVLAVGWARLAAFVGPAEAWLRGVAPFLWGAGVKSVLAAVVVVALARLGGLGRPAVASA